MSTSEQSYTALIHVPYFDHRMFNQLEEVKAKGIGSYTDFYDQEEVNTFFHYFFENTIAKNATEERKQYVYDSKGFSRSVFLAKDIWFTIGRYDVIPFADEENAILKRFAKVFEQSYTRFLDLQKAEAQAREAQIEAALERVRSRSMAMHQSVELSEVAVMVFDQLKKLGLSIIRTWLNIFNSDLQISEVWITSLFEASPYPHKVVLPLNKDSNIMELTRQWKKGAEYLEYSFMGDEAIQYNRTLRELTGDNTLIPDKILNEFPSYYLFEGCHKYGTVGVSSFEPISKDIGEIVKRFAKVFEQTYTRFLDLQKAETQAKEAQIEAGLERVRSRAMAMQTSEELKELIGTVFTELTKLDLVLTRCVILIYEGNEKGVRWWMENSEAPSIPMSFFVKYADLPFFNAYLKGWHERSLKWQYILEGEDKIRTDNVLFNETELSLLPDFVIAGMKANDRVYLSASFNNYGCLNLASLEPLSDEHFDILLRFAEVFDLTYTRFNDLKQAEAQARESQIQLALERVRARTIAMQRSDELKEAAALLFQQAKALGVPAYSCGYNIWEKNEKTFTSWMSTQDGSEINGVPNIP